MVRAAVLVEETGGENRLTAGVSTGRDGVASAAGDEILREATPASMPSSS